MIIYTDGSANNKLPKDKRVGGYSAIIIKDDQVSKIESSADLGLNSYEAELMGFILALVYIRNNKLKKVKIITDCKVIVDAFNKGWLEKWKDEYWYDVKSKELWQIIDELYHSGIEIKWIKGHTGIKFNELADQEAKKARLIEEKRLKL